MQGNLGSGRPCRFPPAARWNAPCCAEWLSRAWGRLLAEVETHAIRQRVQTLRLETNRSLHQAIGLYRSAGYKEVPAFNHEPYAHHWFEKQLALKGIDEKRDDTFKPPSVSVRPYCVHMS
jgi:hypothetical protein